MRCTEGHSLPPMRHPFLLLAFCCTLLCPAQSISGNLNAGSRIGALGYGNVDIYRGSKLIASVLTDARGNFNVRLDTGLYRCVVSFDGFVSSDRMVRVKGDEKADFTVKADPGRPVRSTLASKPSPKAGSSRSMEALGAIAGHSMSDMEDAPLEPALHRRGSRAAAAGILTAGEVNDFAKWDLWTDLAAGELARMRNTWALAPGGRCTVALRNKRGLPLADAEVQLARADGTVLYKARTDNTGKAELWATLDTVGTTIPKDAELQVAYQGQGQRINAPLAFAQGVNHVVLDVPCGPSDNVDVAFVVDATGSMQDELDFLQAELNGIIYRSKQIGDRLNFRFANVFYRDVGPGEEYLTRSQGFTRVLSAAVNFISAQRADGGGDTPEAVEVALDSAINYLPWSAEARARIIFLVLDAGPHNTPAVRGKMQSLVRQAADKGIRIVPVAASGIDKATEYLMRTLALGTNGTYTFLTDHGGVGLPHLAPSTDRYDVESLSGLLVRIMKSFTYMPDCQQVIPELDLQLPDSIVAARPDTDSTATAITSPKDSIQVRWSFYPNPTTGLVYITAGTDIPELYITDLGGKVLQMVKGLRAGQVVEADLSAFATGIYLIRYPVGDRWLSGKVVLRR